MYRNISDFCILILYHATCLSSFISDISSFRDVLKFSLYKVMSSVNGNSFATLFFPIWMPFISFSCLITLARISSTTLNRSGET